MQMNVFADIHKGCQMFLVNEDLSTYSDLEHFRNAASHQLTFRKCMIEISKIFLELANTNDTTAPVRAVVTPRQPQANNVISFHVPNMSSIQRKTEDVALVTKETGHSPKRNVLK
jgi:hypothetical protein